MQYLSTTNLSTAVFLGVPQYSLEDCKCDMADLTDLGKERKNTYMREERT